MFTRILLTGLFLIHLSCKKDHDRLGEKVPAIELFTQKPWRLVSHGLDDNGNGKIDPVEEGIEDCRKIISRIFTRTGLFDDNTVCCGTGIEKEAFTRAFTDTETGIDFLYDSLRISRLTDHELKLCKELILSKNGTVKFILRYSH